jgi:hypothetical protein
MGTPLPWKVKYYDGAAWQNADLRRWNGSSWVTDDMYYYNGSSWVLMTDRTPPTSTYTEQFNSVDGQSYHLSGSNSGLSASLGRCYQGYFDSVHGIQRSMFFYDWSTISSHLTGRVATYGCQVYLNNQHTYYGSGGTAVIGTHANGSAPANFAYNRYDNPGSFHYANVDAHWVYVTNDFAQWFAEQSALGITLYANSTDATYYGYYANSNSIWFSYEK